MNLSLIDDLRNLDLNDIGRWPFLFRAAALLLVMLVATGAGL